MYENPDFIAPSSITANVGTLTGTVAGIQTLNDGNFINIDEASAPANPAMDIDIDFINVRDLFGVVLKFLYNGSNNAHWVETYLRDWAGAKDDQIHQMPFDVWGFQYHTLLIPQKISSKYINTGANKGKVRLSIIHPMEGTNSHDLQIEYCALLGRRFA